MLKFPVGESCRSAVDLEGADLLPEIQTAAASGAAAGVLLRGVLPRENQDSGSSALLLYSHVLAHLGPPQGDLSAGSWSERDNSLPGSMSELAPDREVHFRGSGLLSTWLHFFMVQD